MGRDRRPRHRGGVSAERHVGEGMKERTPLKRRTILATLKPEQDTPRALKQYARMHGAGPGWLFLTSNHPGDIELLRRKLGFTDPDPAVDWDKENHIGNVRYGNEALQLWGACPGLATAKSIAKSISWVDWPKGEASGS